MCPRPVDPCMIGSHLRLDLVLRTTRESDPGGGRPDRSLEIRPETPASALAVMSSCFRHPNRRQQHQPAAGNGKQAATQCPSPVACWCCRFVRNEEDGYGNRKPRKGFSAGSLDHFELPISETRSPDA